MPTPHHAATQCKACASHTMPALPAEAHHTSHSFSCAPARRSAWAPSTKNSNAALPPKVLSCQPCKAHHTTHAHLLVGQLGLLPPLGLGGLAAGLGLGGGVGADGLVHLRRRSMPPHMSRVDRGGAGLPSAALSAAHSSMWRWQAGQPTEMVLAELRLNFQSESS